jgi:uncharacterized membrane protein
MISFLSCLAKTIECTHVNYWGCLPRDGAVQNNGVTVHVLLFSLFIFFNINQHQNIPTFFTFYITSIIFYYYSNKKIHYNPKLFHFSIQFFFFYMTLSLSTNSNYNNSLFCSVLFCTCLCQTNPLL